MRRIFALIALTCLVVSATPPCYAQRLAARPVTAAKTPAQVAIPGFAGYGYSYTIKIHMLTYTGTLMSYIKPGSAAARCGLKPKDIIYRINHVDTPNPEKLKSVLKLNEGMPKRIEYFRYNGKRFEVDVAETDDVRKFTDRFGREVKRASQTEMEDYLITLINQDRAKNGLSGTLRKSSALSRMARSYADDMAKRNFHGHRDPEGRDPWARAKLAGINSINIRENCAYPFPDPNSMAMVKSGEAQLMESPEHKVSIVQADNVCVGCGVAYRNDGGLMIVQVFCPDDVP